jgi:hypothetical protein
MVNYINLLENNMNIKTDKEFTEKMNSYPENIQEKMQNLRKLVHESAEELDSKFTLNESLKWNEPSYISKDGSTLRMDWKTKNPNQYAMYFQCSTRLVETFRIVYKNIFKFEGNRAILFDLDEKILESELNDCIKATVNYHKVKKLPTLGIKE